MAEVLKGEAGSWYNSDDVRFPDSSPPHRPDESVGSVVTSLTAMLSEPPRHQQLPRLLRLSHVF